MAPGPESGREVRPHDIISRVPQAGIGVRTETWKEKAYCGTVDSVQQQLKQVRDPAQAASGFSTWLNCQRWCWEAVCPSSSMLAGSWQWLPALYNEGLAAVPAMQSPKKTISAAQVILRQVCHTESKGFHSPFLQNPVSGLQLPVSSWPCLGWLLNQTAKLSSWGILKLKFRGVLKLKSWRIRFPQQGPAWLYCTIVRPLYPNRNSVLAPFYSCIDHSHLMSRIHSGVLYNSSFTFSLNWHL